MDNTRKFDRIVKFDPASREFPIRKLVAAKKPRSYTWRVARTLDQGREGACVGFAWAHELLARPVVIDAVDTHTAITIYQNAKTIDEWLGEDYDGTSVLAGAKAIAVSGYMKEYRWGFGLDDMILALGYAGPGIAGLNWYAGMFDTEADGFIRPTGSLRGGHAILVRGVNIKGKYFVLRNSWGPDWGVGGDCRISFEDMERLLREQGEFCIPVGRKKL